MSGLWPYDVSKGKRLQRIVIFLFNLTFLEVQVLKLITSRFDTEVLVKILPSLLPATIVVVKHLNTWINGNLVKALFEEIKDDWTVLRLEELMYVRKIARQSKVHGMYYTNFIYLSYPLFLLLELAPCILDAIIPLNESRPFTTPFPAEYLVDENKYFYPILIHMYVSVALNLIVVIATDTAFLTLLFHACGKFNVVGYRMEHLFDDEVQNLSKRIANAVKYHNGAVEYVETLKTCYSFSYLIQLLLVVVALAFLLLELSETLWYDVGIQVVLGRVLRIYGHFFLMYLNVWPAQKLIDSSEDIFYKTYAGRWYEAPPRMQKELLFIMQRTMEPCILTVANLINGSLQSLASTVHLSMSYFMVLYSLRES